MRDTKPLHLVAGGKLIKKELKVLRDLSEISRGGGEVGILNLGLEMR